LKCVAIFPWFCKREGVNNQKQTPMKKYILLAFAASSVLAVGIPSVNAAEHKMTRPEMAAMCQKMSADDCRLMMREMLNKGRKTKVAMADELKGDREFREIFNSRVGSDAPHQERNPSAHPELFTPKKK
jgi:hypothetical protein